MSVAVLILAAGAARRMGGTDKLLQPVGGVPLLRLLAGRALQSGAPVGVALPVPGEARVAALGGLAVSRIPVADAAGGMGRSIAAGVAALGRGCRGLMILPADMPEITAEDIACLIAAFEGAGGDRPVRGAAEDGSPGHPVVFPARLFSVLAGLTGDEGARSALAGEKVLLVPLPGRHAVTDLDTPGDWTAWRQSSGLQD